ncbi:hypothetical protein BQ8420_20650 [Nocardiopsis sp. JB363]|nr:hypothetical protein BQ8420_20650 [Nocardiopsis sp. JB363]
MSHGSPRPDRLTERHTRPDRHRWLRVNQGDRPGVEPGINEDLPGRPGRPHKTVLPSEVDRVR